MVTASQTQRISWIAAVGFDLESQVKELIEVLDMTRCYYMMISNPCGIESGAHGGRGLVPDRLASRDGDQGPTLVVVSQNGH